MVSWRNIGMREGNRKRGEGLTLLLQGLAVLAAGALVLLGMAATPWRNLPALLGAFIMLLLAEWALLRAWLRLRAQLQAREQALAQLQAERTRAEREAAARARLLAVLSHELRTPISGVLGMAALLRGTKLTPEQASYVESIDASGRMLLSMVNEILEEARLEAERASEDAQRARREPFDPVRLVEEVVELLAPRAHARGLEVAGFIAPEIRGEWLGDASKIKQALMNLVGNAIKFTRKGGVLVRVERVEGGLHFSVSDTGPGVPERMEKRIFEPFVRGDGDGAVNEGGAGLGLAITRDLLMRMGAELKLDNRPGRGATFHFLLPAAPAREEDGRPDVKLARALAGRRLWLVMPEGPTAWVIAEYVARRGGKADPLPVTALADHLDMDADIIVDARMAEGLVAALEARGNRPFPARVWLLLAPEERIRLHDLLQDARLAGYLLRPPRRRTLEERLGMNAPEAVVGVAARRMRLTRHRMRQKEAEDTAAPLVMVAEDDPVNARVLATLLRRGGYRVQTFADGAALLEHLRDLPEGEPDRWPLCIIADVHMPRMDGPDMVQALRALERARGLPPLPVLMLTAGGEDERRRSLAAGANTVLAKPVDADTLLEALARLGTRGAHQDMAAE